jgi:Ca2+-binding RTX toxin-like protein
MPPSPINQQATVTDFVAGAGGDKIDLNGILSMAGNPLSGYVGGTNPFTSGHLQLVQDGADTLLQVDVNGSGDGAQFSTLLRLANTTATNLTGENFSPAWPPDGSAPVGQTINGTSGPDTLNGTVGDDVIVAGDGYDVVNGDAGNDQIFGGDGGGNLMGGYGDDVIEGGAGNDMIDGGDGFNTLRGGDGSDNLNNGAGSGGLLEGGAGDDLIIGAMSVSYDQILVTAAGDQAAALG